MKSNIWQLDFYGITIFSMVSIRTYSRNIDLVTKYISYFLKLWDRNLISSYHIVDLEKPYCWYRKMCIKQKYVIETINLVTKFHLLYVKYLPVLRGFASDCITMCRLISDGTSCAILNIFCKHFFPIFCIIRFLWKLKPKHFGIEIASSGVRTPHLSVKAFKP